VQRFRKQLFQGSQWRFAQVAEFTVDEQQEFLGDERWSHLQRLDVEVLAVPRALTAIFRLEPDKLKNLLTASDVYSACVKSLLDEAANNASLQAAGFKSRATLRLLAVLAFEMVRQNNSDGIREDDFDDFLEDLLKRYANVCKWPDEDVLRSQLRLLGQSNEFLQNGFLEEGEPTQILWRNRTLQEWFASVWLAKFADKRDREDMSGREYLEHDQTTREDYWVWRFAMEMPAKRRSNRKWLKLLRIVYQPGNGRPTEMIYRSWLTVKSATNEPGHSARQLDENYKNEVLKSYRDQKSSSARAEIDTLMQRIPPSVNDTLEFKMGSFADIFQRIGNPVSQLTQLDSAFDLAKVPVMNTQYELFDASHASRR